MLKYIKNNVFNPLSWMGVFFLVIALYFSADISIKCYNNHKELSYREKVECMFTSVSAIRKKREFRHNGNGKTKYYQDLRFHMSMMVKSIQSLLKIFILAQDMIAIIKIRRSMSGLIKMTRRMP